MKTCDIIVTMNYWLLLLLTLIYTLPSKASWFPKSPLLKKAYSQAIDNISPLSPIAVKEAFQFYEQKRAKDKLRDDYLAVVDFSLKSTTKRLALIDLKNGNIEFFKVSHGKGSDLNHDTVADKLSSKESSNATPPGFHKMGVTYRGQHGLSLRMHGLEDRNKTSFKRLIVLHGAKYVSWKHTGRSKGCPAVENKHTKYIIDKLKNGGLFYHYFKP